MKLANAKAHITDDDRSQCLLDHLMNTAELASGFAAHFGYQDKAYVAGLYHDLGKCSESFLHRLEGGPRVDHSTAGALYMAMKGMLQTSLAIASHHAGLPDMGSGDKFECGTFWARLKNYALNDDIKEAGVELDEIANSIVFADVIEGEPLEGCITEHFLFSSLVDADHIDTGRFFGNESPSTYDKFPILCMRILDKAKRYLSCSKDKPINSLRNAMLRECLEKACRPQGLYTLTMPTGSGKTFSSLAFAARHAQLHSNVRRIIYVIPYISIIEQNAAVIRDIVGKENVLESHSTAPVIQPDCNGESADTLTFAQENWDAPIVVTTNEQFFESLFSCKPGKCRKIHNISDSVIIFDEAQMLPLKFLELFTATIENLARSGRYGVTAILCTATQPSLDRFLKLGEPEEIVDSELSSNPVFRRVGIKGIGDVGLERICDISTGLDQVLVIVNRKRDAQVIFDAWPDEGRFCLTTNLTPHSRRGKLAMIRDLLAKGRTCRVVSTSLIEAGVDVDFPVVFREKNGLDSIMQAAGRCNREGLLPGGGTVYVFDSGNTPNYADFSRKVNALEEVLSKHEDLFSSSAIRAYYDSYYSLSETGKCMDMFKHRFEHLPFETISNAIKIIDENEAGIFICQNDDAIAILSAIRIAGLNRQLLRRSAEYTVRCPKHVIDMLIERGFVTMIDDGFLILNRESDYNADKGFDYFDIDKSEALFF